MNKKKSLKQTNPYLQNPKKYQKALITDVTSSMAIETGKEIMKLDIKKSIPEYEIKKEESMIDISVREIEEDEVVVPVILNASVEIRQKDRGWMKPKILLRN